MSDGSSGLLDTFRDNIYISDYILSMFTYKTYEKELYWEIKNEQEDKRNEEAKEAGTEVTDDVKRKSGQYLILVKNTSTI